jgi:DNA-binding NarL/FixJ family response regulator
MGMALVRVLVAEDFVFFRQFICSMLGKNPRLQVIGEVSDGADAVRKAEELQPDLILLDIGLPSLDGIKAARRIRKLSPASRIVFVSQESSADVVQEAFRTGAMGYVVKTHAGSELLDAVEAVLHGRRFVSSGVSGDFDHTADWQTLDPDRKSAVPWLVPRQVRVTRNHEVQFSSDDESFLSGFTRFITTALDAGNAVIVIATESHRNRLIERLEAQGLNVEAAIEQGSYVPLDVGDTLGTFMVNDLPDPDRFRKATGDLLDAAVKAAKGKRTRVSACGECAPFLRAQGKSDAAIRLEHLWDEIARTYDVDILCGYVMESPESEQKSHFYERICAEHSVVHSQ